MLKNDCLFYRDYLKYRDLKQKKVLISKTKKSYLIGPLISNNFDERSFYKRLTSNSIYSLNIYKKFLIKRKINMINLYVNKLKDNEVVEVFKDNSIIVHKIISVPVGENEKK